MTIENDQLDKLATLSNIALNDSQRVRAREDLNAIITLIDSIIDVPTAGIEPLAHPLDATLALRADAVTETDQRQVMQQAAPLTRDGYYLVPRVVE